MEGLHCPPKSTRQILELINLQLEAQGQSIKPYPKLVLPEMGNITRKRYGTNGKDALLVDAIEAYAVDGM